jgi:hypothetical protein
MRSSLDLVTTSIAKMEKRSKGYACTPTPVLAGSALAWWGTGGIHVNRLIIKASWPAPGGKLAPRA